MDRPRTYDSVGCLIRFRVFPEEVMGKYCIVEAVVPPGAGAPPNHHAGEFESFYVLEGTVDFVVDGVPRSVVAGEHVVVPDGAVHAFAATGDRAARLLIINAPGDMHARFFAEAGRAVPDDTALPSDAPDVGRILAVGSAVGMSFPAPAPA